MDGGRLREGDEGGFIRDRVEGVPSSDVMDATATEVRRCKDGGIPFSISFAEGRGDSRAADARGMEPPSLRS